MGLWALPSRFGIQRETFRGIEYLPRVKTGLPALDREGSFLAERDGFRESVEKTQYWTGAFLDDRLVGLAILRADAYGPARPDSMEPTHFENPQTRNRLIIVHALIREAQQLNQKTMRVYTLAFLDHLAPGAILNLKSGGRIEAEYLQLELRTVS